MRYPNGQWLPGPPESVWPDCNKCSGAVLHSAEGSWYGLQHQLVGGNVSWHFSVLQDGRVFQHYELDASCWHAGSRAANATLIGIEHEGGGPNNPSEPLTPLQLAASVTLVGWLASQFGWRMERGVTLFEHNELTNTRCPSGRIPWERYMFKPETLDRESALNAFVSA